MGDADPRAGSLSGSLLDFTAVQELPANTNLDSASTQPNSQERSIIEDQFEDLFLGSSNSNEEDDVSELMITPIQADLTLVRDHRAISVDFLPSNMTGDIQTERTDDIQTKVSEYHIPLVHRNEALQFVSANWSSMQYISDFEIISFGGYINSTKNAHDKVIWFDLRHMNIASELPIMKVSRFAPVIILVDEFVYVFGGGFELPIDCTRVEAERLNIRTKTWENLPNLTYPKRTANPSYYRGVIYLVGGLGSSHNEAYRIPQGDYIPLNISYPLPDLETGIRSISYIIGNELVLLNNNFQQVFQLEPEFTCKSWELIKNHECVNVRSAVSPIDQGNLVYSTALFIGRDSGIHRNHFCVYNQLTRRYHVKVSVILCPNTVRRTEIASSS